MLTWKRNATLPRWWHFYIIVSMRSYQLNAWLFQLAIFVLKNLFTMTFPVIVLLSSKGSFKLFAQGNVNGINCCHMVTKPDFIDAIYRKLIINNQNNIISVTLFCSYKWRATNEQGHVRARKAQIRLRIAQSDLGLPWPHTESMATPEISTNN